MTYGDIIKNNSQKHPWSKYAYHFTDITNAVNILAEGRLYSRNKALAKGLMLNDNASEKILAYNEFVKDYVRFYFRPMTPTQYYNEGYKHPDFRFEGNKNANMSIPVFFLFDLETMLESGQIKFSAKTLAGINPKSPTAGIDNFASLPFEKIYGKNYSDGITRPFMHAELICRDEFPLGYSLRKIVCRNEVEASTLQNLLAEKNPVLAEMYKSVIVTEEKIGLEFFERNGLFVEEISKSEIHYAWPCIRFSNTSSKQSYDNQKIRYNSACKDSTVNVRIDIRGMVIGEKEFRPFNPFFASVNYHSPTELSVPLNIQAFAKVTMKIFFDDHIAAFVACRTINADPKSD